MTSNTGAVGHGKASTSAYPDDAHLSTFTQNIRIFASLIEMANSEFSKDEPDTNRLSIYLADIKSLQAELVAQRDRAIAANGQDDPNVIALSTVMQGDMVALNTRAMLRVAQIETGMAAAKEKYDANMAALDDDLVKILVQNSDVIKVDNKPIQDNDAIMSATTDKDYIDARLKAMSDSLDHRLETAAAKSDGRLEVIETRLDGRLASIEHMLVAKFAALDANVHKTNADTIKWTVGLFITIGLLGLALMTFLINNSGKFSAVQPPPATSTAQSGATAPAATAAPQVVPATPAAKQ
ncbi:hypothetical protein [Janthinobacterium sp. RB2P8]|uniref:hypothetical protein n=1 Tax=Janthinobacterium sp. RB2P8 TaxID=3424191 RepID=UPI003F21F9CA